MWVLLLSYPTHVIIIDLCCRVKLSCRREFRFPTPHFILIFSSKRLRFSWKNVNFSENRRLNILRENSIGVLAIAIYHPEKIWHFLTKCVTILNIYKFHTGLSNVLSVAYHVDTSEVPLCLHRFWYDVDCYFMYRAGMGLSVTGKTVSKLHTITPITEGHKSKGSVRVFSFLSDTKISRL